MVNPKSRNTPSSYPAASLGLCLKKAVLALEEMPTLGEIPRAWATQNDFALACGYKGFDANSAPKGLIAAMSHFGLIERDAQKRLRFKAELLSAMADDASRGGLIAKAVVRPKFYQALFAVFGAQPAPSRQEVTKHLVEACGFASRPAQIMASNFTEDLALLRSGTASPLAAENVESITTPSGAHVRIAFDRELSAGDLIYIEKFLRLKRESASSVSEQGLAKRCEERAFELAAKSKRQRQAGVFHEAVLTSKADGARRAEARRETAPRLSQGHGRHRRARGL